MTIGVKPTVLVVEDERDLTTLLRYNLEKEGYRVAEAHDGEEALLMLNEERPDLVLLDWMMPETNGYELLRRLRKEEVTARLPVIMVTAKTEEGSRVHARRRVDEMEAAAELLRSLGVEPRVAEAAAAWLRDLAG